MDIEYLKSYIYQDDIVKVLIHLEHIKNTLSEEECRKIYADLLSSAIIRGKELIALRLVEMGADVDMVVMSSGQTCVHLASYWEASADLGLAIVTKSKELDAVDEDGNTALHLACDTENEELGLLLIDNGADVYKVNKDGNTPLILACLGCQPRVIERLIASNVDINAKNNIGATALCMATTRRDLSLMSFLLAEGATIDIQDDKGWSPLQSACLLECVASVRLLLEHGADPNMHSDLVDPPLHLVCVYPTTEIAEALLSYGANAYLRNSKNVGVYDKTCSVAFEDLIRGKNLKGGS